MDRNVALKGFLSGLSWPFPQWTPSINAEHIFMATMPFVQAHAFKNEDRSNQGEVTKNS
jgi:hypothetical protein